MKDNDSGKWVGFFSYMANDCDLNTWQANSMIVSAVADEPDGVIFDYFFHNCVCNFQNVNYILHHLLQTNDVMLCSLTPKTLLL